MMIQTYSSRWLKPPTRMGFPCDAAWWPIIMFCHRNCHFLGGPFSEKAEWEWSLVAHDIQPYEGRYVLNWDCTKWLGEIRVTDPTCWAQNWSHPKIIMKPCLEGCLLLVKRVNNHKAMNPVSITLPTCTRVLVGDIKKLNFLVLHPDKGMKPHRIRD